MFDNVCFNEVPGTHGYWFIKIVSLVVTMTFGEEKYSK